MENNVINGDVFIYSLHVMKRGMELELRTGIKITGKANTFQVVRDRFGIRKRRKQDVYDAFMAIIGNDPAKYLDNLIEKGYVEVA